MAVQGSYLTKRLISASRGVRGAIWAAITRYGIVSPRRSAQPRPGHDDYAEPAAADIPAVRADLDSITGELIAA